MGDARIQYIIYVYIYLSYICIYIYTYHIYTHFDGKVVNKSIPHGPRVPNVEQPVWTLTNTWARVPTVQQKGKMNHD